MSRSLSFRFLLQEYDPPPPPTPESPTNLQVEIIERKGQITHTPQMCSFRVTMRSTYRSS